MDARELQQWLIERGANIVADGVCGPASRAAIISVFTNKDAPAVDDSHLEAFAKRCGCSLKQLKAVATVESGGSGFDKQGRPKILFERHYFHRLTQGKWTPAIYSDPKGGGYDHDSWDKLTRAACRDPEAAFQSASWGKFQVMGAHWKALGYVSPIGMAFSTTKSEADHYEMLVRFIQANKLEDEMRMISTKVDDCRPFAAKYNGPKYELMGGYHIKLAKAMQ